MTSFNNLIYCFLEKFLITRHQNGSNMMISCIFYVRKVHILTLRTLLNLLVNRVIKNNIIQYKNTILNIYSKKVRKFIYSLILCENLEVCT